MSRILDPQHIRTIGRWLGWVAFIGVLLSLLTGYGITQTRIVSPLTFGLLGKAFSQFWHEYAGILLFLVMIAHVSIALWWRKNSPRKPEQEK
jgi:ABC-type Fe3+-siderophore transport system permease subunit